ncbi:hypothetical protein ACMFMG_004606 [Clarireedia jacksonii]
MDGLRLIWSTTLHIYKQPTLQPPPTSSPPTLPTTIFLKPNQTTTKHTITMAASTSTVYSTSSITLINRGRGGYNGPNQDSEDDDQSRISFSSPINKRGDDDEEEDGRGGYN